MEKYRQNIFGIGEVYELQKEGQWIDRTRETYREYGYFGGGQNPAFSPGVYSTIERIDYSNDTQIASVRGSLPVARSTLKATGNSNFGYFGGGSPGVRSTVERIDYSNDNASASVRGPLSLARIFPAGIGNINFGYFGGGTSSLEVVSIIDRINYSNDLASTSVRSYFNISGSGTATVGNSKYGYFCGGTTSTVNYTSRCDRLDYSNDTQITSARRGLTLNSLYTQSTSNSNYGWLYGRFSGAGSWIYRIDYSNDLSANSFRSYLNAGRGAGGSSGNSNFGYVSGGTTDNFNTTILSSTERLDYSNDTVGTNFRGPLSTTRNSVAATSSASFGGSPVSYLGAPWLATAPYGYFSGAALGALDRVDYTNDTAATTLRSQLSESKEELSAVGNSNFGYFGGGINVSATAVSTVDRLDYSNDLSSASVRGPLSSAKSRGSATGNSNFGYFAGFPVSTIDRINYSNDSVISTARGTLDLASPGQARYASTGNSNFGYFAGGYIPAGSVRYSIVNRIDYSNDTSISSKRSPLTNVRSFMGATGTPNFGYFGGGSALGTTSIVERIDYSNDTQTPSVRGILSLARFYLTATGNSNFGYFGGGNVPGPTLYSTVDRIDYSNDTQTASVRGPLSLARRQLAASSSQAYGGAPNTTTDPIPTYIRANTVWNNRNTLDVPYKRVLGSYGYFGGGSPGPLSIVDRIDYSNDLATASIRGSLTLNRHQFSATGNLNFGYYIAGNTATPTVVVTSIDRIDYSNDGATALLRSYVNVAGTEGRSFGATGNSNFGYIGNWSYSSNTNRIDYSNDNLTASIRGPLSSAKGYVEATGNENFGYFGGGRNPSGDYSIVDRIYYSNDLSKSSVRGPLSIARRGLTATGNENFGYFGGGGLSGDAAFYSTVDRIDYSNDTATASIRGPLTTSPNRPAATGNSNFGYFVAGYNSPLTFSTVNRVDYSNDTQTPSIRGPLSQERSVLASTTNARNS